MVMRPKDVDRMININSLDPDQTVFSCDLGLQPTDL